MVCIRLKVITENANSIVLETGHVASTRHLQFQSLPFKFTFSLLGRKDMLWCTCGNQIKAAGM